jgi:hypothetical protein
MKQQTPHPSLRGTFSLKGRREDIYNLLPLREKVPEGRMRGFS